MSDLPLRWFDDFVRQNPGPRWTGGHANASREASIYIDSGVHIEIQTGTQYASAALVTRWPVIGDFDARVRFTVSNPTTGTTFELAAIAVDPPAEPALSQDAANEFTRSRAYDVHGTPPYVSSECDEGDGWRIAWNRGPALSRPGLADTAISDNHFNRYGTSIGGGDAPPISGWLRLVRAGTHWATYRRVGDEGLWEPTGRVRHMNMPDPIYLRLAAKHWVKGRAGLVQAPANSVTFHRFELRGERSTEDTSGSESIPDEVALVRELRGCRSCPAFAIENLYGPFPQVASNDKVVKAFASPEPAALYGCRKAPVMLIGINPNLPGHFIFPRIDADANWQSGSHRLVPFFSDDEAYAHHYRFGPTPAMAVRDASGLESLLRKEARSLLIADRPGEIVPADGKGGGSFRWQARRAARLELKFDDGSLQVHEVRWLPGENYAVVRRRFAPADIIAGCIDAGVVGHPVEAVELPALDTYYGNAATLLSHLGKRYGSELKLGEDMSLHDAVACASPKWNAAEMPVDTIASSCLLDHRWLHRQIMQSAPDVIIVAGRTALRLFAMPEAGTLDPPLNSLPQQPGGRDGLYHRVAEGDLRWRYRAGAGMREARVIIAPHLSYSENFESHAYLEAPIWTDFKGAHNQVAKWLEKNKRVRPVHGSDDVEVLFDGQGDPKWATLRQLDQKAEDFLRPLLIDPFELLSSAVFRELNRLGVEVGPLGRLQRSAGPCNFCVNGIWRFQEGCPYGVAAG